MGATTVTGAGVGAAHGGVKGPGNGRNLFVPQITPHIVIANTATLAAGTATVTFPSVLAGGAAGHVIMLTPPTGNVASYGTLTDDADGNFESFIITGDSTDVIHYAIMSVGLGLNA